MLPWNLSFYAVVACPSVCMSVCMSVTVTIATCMQGHRLTKYANLAIFGSCTVGALKFGFGDLLLFGLFKILMATLDEFSVLFILSSVSC